jgi:hypothetical protein
MFLTVLSALPLAVLAGVDGSFSVDPFKAGLGVALESDPNVVWDSKIGNPEGALVATSDTKTGGGIFVANSKETLLTFDKPGSVLSYGVQFESLSSDSKAYAPIISFRSTTSEQFLALRFVPEDGGVASVFASYSDGDKPVTDLLVASKVEWSQDRWTDAAASLSFNDEKEVSLHVVLDGGNKADLQFSTAITDAGKQQWAAAFGESGTEGGVSYWDNLNYKLQQTGGGAAGVEAVPEAPTWAAIAAIGAITLVPALCRHLRKQPQRA